MTEVHARLTAANGILHFRLAGCSSIPGVVATSLDTPGLTAQVVYDAPRNLGISAEAYALMATLPQAADDEDADIEWGHGPSGIAFRWRGSPDGFWHADTMRMRGSPPAGCTPVVYDVPQLRA